MELRIEKDVDGVGRIVLDRPEAKNALTIAMRDGITEAVRDFRADPKVRAVLVTGEGTAFCAGMDLSASTLAQAGKPGFNPRSTSEALRVGVQTFIRELWQLDKPTVAAVNGAAVGPGAHLALACDFVFVSDRTKFMWSFAKWGLVADAGGAYLLPRLVGMARAKAMLMLGETTTGSDAVAQGLAYRCVESDDALVPEALALTQQLAAGPTRSLGLSKQLLNWSFETDLGQCLESESHFQALAATSPDVVEGMTAFREKRDAKFTGA
ncbi:MAG TPA: enoyl-CoA hydratase-related protein [Acidimicrobiia bacterium]|jgi:2-(1,2-epoxy-1,2-dihydrophenyl)acetyl-CoA isomerase|nr:enoyl-CoA hydratase-related protein [Acidimicrobiia bacterium]